MLKFPNPIKSFSNRLVLCTIAALFVLNSWNYFWLTRANKTIAVQSAIINSQKVKIQSLDSKIRNHLATAQFERAAIIDKINKQNLECGQAIKDAVAAASVKPAKNVFIATPKRNPMNEMPPILTLTSEVKSDEANIPQNCPNIDNNTIIISNAYSLRDIQDARADSAN